MRSTPWSRRRPSMKEETLVAMTGLCPVLAQREPSGLGRLAERLRGGHVREVRERLWEVAHHLAVARVVFLAEEPQVVGGRHCGVVDLARLGRPVLAGQALGQPEGAGQERALATRLAVAVGVAADEPP